MFDTVRRRRTLDIWPGYVDALASLLLVVVFVLLVFTLGHFTLSNALVGRERALERLEVQVSELARLLSLEEAESEGLRRSVGELTASLERSDRERGSLAAALAKTGGELERAEAELASSRASAALLESDVASLGEERSELQRQIAALGRSLEESRAARAAEAERTARAEAELERLNRQIAALRTQLTEVSNALDLSREKAKEQEAEIADLGNRLNVALASKVQELARYRSEFFGRLREALGDRPDIRIVGDRFVFQSELLFATASADLGDPGREQVRRLVQTLNEITPRIPGEIDWVLQIDGHTDRRPIQTEEFPSNWELSTARALAIVKYAIELGVPPRRLAANGFAEFHPLVSGRSESAYAKNRRIEVKLTNR